MALTRVELENFTAFGSLKLDLCPGNKQARSARRG